MINAHSVRMSSLSIRSGLSCLRDYPLPNHLATQRESFIFFVYLTQMIRNVPNESLYDFSYDLFF